MENVVVPAKGLGQEAPGVVLQVPLVAPPVENPAPATATQLVALVEFQDKIGTPPGATEETLEVRVAVGGEAGVGAK